MRRPLVCSGVSLVALIVGASAFAQPPSIDDMTSEQLDGARRTWLAEHAAPLSTVEAGHGFDDMQPLKAMVGDARVVALGEGTHGTREYFQAKHRLLEFLATEMGFRLFSIEANMPEAYALNDYVQGAPGDVEKLIGGMYFWTWNTEEVRDMVEWMRAFNARRPADTPPLQFTGFDMQTRTVSLQILKDFLQAHDADMLTRLQPSLDLLARDASESQEFGCVTGRFPVAEARGKQVVFSGWVKTAAVDAWAGLWWRVDGPTPRFDNMQDRGVRGTSDWLQVSLTLDVPQDAQDIYFGLVKPGRGTAWFDSLEVTLDGKPWSNPKFDLGFENDQPEGLICANPSRGDGSAAYPCTLDHETRNEGAASLRIDTMAAQPKGPTPAELRAAAAEVLKAVTGAEPAFAAKTSASGAAWIVQNARLLDQWAGMTASANGSVHRDRCMALNAQWILDRNPGQRMVIWAHNWHVRDERPFMGFHLRKALGKDYLNLAFCSARGEYFAMPPGKRNSVHSLTEAPEDSFEGILDRCGTPRMVVDIRQADSEDPGSAFLTETRPFGGVIGAIAMDSHYMVTRLRKHFDLVFFVRETTAARQLGERPARGQ